jgi:hypothetical protein
LARMQLMFLLMICSRARSPISVHQAWF